MRHYVLDAERRPVLVLDDTRKSPMKERVAKMMEWMLNMAAVEAENRQVVGRADLPGIEVCTDFLGVAINREGPPQVFETAAFVQTGGRSLCGRGECVIYGRCATWEQAERMHAEAVAEYTKAVKG